MLDVHAPHEAAHSWTDFFIHIATIVLGLLIAIGLEQTVEAIHHRRVRMELRESLLADANKAVKDTSAATATRANNFTAPKTPSSTAKQRSPKCRTPKAIPGSFAAPDQRAP